MGNGMNKVLPGLYLGSCRDGKDKEQLDANKITHIVSIHDNAREVVKDKMYLCLRVADSPDENLSRHFSLCNDFIHKARTEGGSVLIHCLAGVSRSAAITAAYLMSITNLSSKDAIKVVRGARSIANPNYGFVTQLKDYESHSLSQERKRIHETYPQQDDAKEVEKECKKLIKLHDASFIPQSALPQSAAGISLLNSPSRRKPLSTPASPRRMSLQAKRSHSAGPSQLFSPLSSPRRQKPNQSHQVSGGPHS